MTFVLVADLRTAFDLLDRDQDGMINNQELQFMLRNLGIELSDELIDGLMKEASKTGGLLFAMTFESLRDLAHSPRKIPPEQTHQLPQLNSI